MSFLLRYREPGRLCDSRKMLYSVGRSALSYDLQQGVRLLWCSAPPHIWPYVSFTTFTTFTTAVSPQSRGEMLQGALNTETAASCPAWREKREDGLQLFRLRFDCTFTTLKCWCKKLIIESGMCVLLPDALCSYALCMHIQMSK